MLLRLAKVCLCLLTVLPAAQAQTLSPAIKKNIDAQAFAFTGQHCSDAYISRAPRELAASYFPFLTKMLDKTYADLKKDQPSMVFRSDNNGKNTYRALISKSAQNSTFLLISMQQGKAYTYACQLLK